MLDRVIDVVVDESKWMAFAMLVSLAAVAARVPWRGPGGLTHGPGILRGMNLFYGGVIGIMGCGHCLAVAAKAYRGTLEGSPWLLYPMGVALALPAGWLAYRSGWRADGPTKATTTALNGWLGLFLVALGPHNLPLAAPAALNVAYLHHSRRRLGRLIVTVTVAAHALLLVGSLVFLASGQSFEQFRGM